MPSTTFNCLFKNALDAYLTGTFKAMLLTAAYVPDKTHDNVSDIVANEITASGYTAGGAIVIPSTLLLTTVTELWFSDAVWSGFTGSTAYASIYKVSDGSLVNLLDFQGLVTKTNAELRVKILSPLRIRN
jgi:hypothetical protein